MILDTSVGRCILFELPTFEDNEQQTKRVGRTVTGRWLDSDPRTQLPKPPGHRVRAFLLALQ